eukprot:416202-Prymnesium_polylepis.1
MERERRQKLLVEGTPDIALGVVDALKEGPRTVRPNPAVSNPAVGQTRRFHVGFAVVTARNR